MRVNNKLKVILVPAIGACLAVGIYFGVNYYLDYKKSQQKSSYSKNIQRKLAYTSDPARLLKKAEDAETKGEFREAIIWYDLARLNLNERDPRKGFAYYRKANCYYNMADYPKARETLEYALNHYRSMPELDNALFLIAKIYEKMGDFELARKTYNTIIRMFPPREEEAKKLQSQLPPENK